MIEYLSGAPLPLPVEPVEPPAEATHGRVAPSFERGELLLQDEHGRAFRLSWTGEEQDGEHTRALPAGSYALRTYRIVRAEGDELWHVSATAPRIRTLEVRAGEELRVELDDTIRMTARVRGDQAQMNVQGDEDAGLSIFRDGLRIPIDFQVVDGAGEPRASGRMRYG